jgi:hypothetical protein
MNPITPSTLQTDINTLVDHLGAGVQVPIGTPVALMFVAAALLFLPTVLGDGVGANLGGNLGGSVDLEGTIGHDVQHIMIDIVGILQHPQAVEHL